MRQVINLLCSFTTSSGQTGPPPGWIESGGPLIRNRLTDIALPEIRYFDVVGKTGSPVSGTPLYKKHKRLSRESVR